LDDRPLEGCAVKRWARSATVVASDRLSGTNPFSGGPWRWACQPRRRVCRQVCPPAEV